MNGIVHIRYPEGRSFILGSLHLVLHPLDVSYFMKALKHLQRKHPAPSCQDFLQCRVVKMNELI
jgi:hypothetical protein